VIASDAARGGGGEPDPDLSDPFELPGFTAPGSPVWRLARGARSADSRGREVLDLAMCFGSNLFGHGEGPRAVLGKWLTEDVPAPGLGDLDSNALRKSANRALCEWAARGWGGGRAAGELRSLVLHTGSEAVETGLKTALRATGRSRIVAFEGAYHGTFGLALAATHGERFRTPFADQYAGTVRWESYGEAPTLDEHVACVVVEPIQGRAGVRIPPPGFLAELRAACDEVGALLVLDAVLVGSGRCGAALDAACDPDVVCLGKALGSGVPASAVVVRAQVAERAWGGDPGEAIHTSTFVGEPLASAAVLHTLGQLDERGTEIATAAPLWRDALAEAADHVRWHVRGRGLLWALDSGRAGEGWAAAQQLRDRHGVLVVPSGADARSITLLPPLACTDADRSHTARALIAVAGLMA
jgi:acetylornithine/succinyldiaminopimelate/putrescine aminotransferase